MSAGRAARRRAAAIERKAKQRWARGVRWFSDKALGAFTVKIIRPAHLVMTHPEVAASLLWGWFTQACEHPHGPLCMTCDTELTPPVAPGAWPLVSGTVATTGSGLITGVCKGCAVHSDAELLRLGIDYLRQLWPDLHAKLPATLLREAGYA